MLQSNSLSESPDALESLLHELEKKLEIVQPKKKRHYLLHTNGAYIRLEYASIYYIEASNKYATIVYVDEKSYYKKFITSDKLFELEMELDPDIFIRCHRSFIVNVNLIQKCVKEGKGGIVYFDHNKNIPEIYFSQSYKSKLIELGFIR